jgi:hypothetical protein
VVLASLAAIVALTPWRLGSLRRLAGG